MYFPISCITQYFSEIFRRMSLPCKKKGTHCTAFTRLHVCGVLSSILIDDIRVVIQLYIIWFNTRHTQRRYALSNSFLLVGHIRCSEK